MARRVLIDRSRLSPFLFALLAGLGCDPKPAEQRVTGSPTSSARASVTADHAQRLSNALARWPERWRGEPAPPDCAGILPAPELGVCASTARALALVQSTGPASKELLPRAAELALAAQRATEALRRVAFGELLADREGAEAPAASAPPGSGSARAHPPHAPASARPSGSAVDPHLHEAHDHAARKHDNPALAAVLAYSRLSSLGLRQVSVYLEQGPLEVRRRAFAELTRLGAEQPRWHALEAVAQQAQLLESDVALKRELASLVGQLRKNRGKSPARSGDAAR